MRSNKFWVLLTLPLLAACDDIPHAWSENDLREIARHEAEDIADAASGGGRSNEALERRVLELEAQIVELKLARINDAQAALKHRNYADESIDRLFKNDETVVSNLNWLLAKQGQSPIPKADK